MNNCTQNNHVNLQVILCGRYRECQNVVCTNCSYVIDGVHYCATCRDDIQNNHYETSGECPQCGNERAPIYSDRHPDGIGSNEISGWQACENCGYATVTD